MTSHSHSPRTRTLFFVRKGGAWIVFLLAALLIGGVFWAFGDAEPPGQSSPPPINSESELVANQLEKFPGSDESAVLVVASPTDGGALSDAEFAALVDLQSTLVDDEEQLPPPIVSDDDEAALLIVPIEAGSSNTDIADTVGELRTHIADVITVDSLELSVTGGPAFAGDIASAFDGADFRLLLVTVIIVAILLIITYRSPVLWLIPLLVVTVAERTAITIADYLAANLDMEYNFGIVSVLVFGAGTNYALLLISRYREDLYRFTDHREALSYAWKKALPSIAASNVTTVMAIATLLLAVIPSTRGLGLMSAVSLIVTLVATVTLLPAALSLFGRGLFWPFTPQPAKEMSQGKLWSWVTRTVLKHPGRSVSAGLLLLVVMSAGLFETSIGLNQMEKFRVPSESARGLETLSEHFPPGEAQPITVIADTDVTDSVLSTVEDMDGIVRAEEVNQTDDGELTQITVISEYTPETDESLAQIDELRDAIHSEVGDHAHVGGLVAGEKDSRDAAARDFWLIAPLVFGIILITLLIFLRAIVAPLILILVNTLSSVAAIGAGAWLSRIVFDQQALDHQVPLLAFIFLVALGVDYTMFLVLRIRQEAREHGTEEGMVRALSSTGTVITSAGVVLAGVFVALGLLPLVVLGQIGIIVALGVLVDTFVVRSVIVPSLFGLLGDTMWWPGALASRT